MSSGTLDSAPQVSVDKISWVSEWDEVSICSTVCGLQLITFFKPNSLEIVRGWTPFELVNRFHWANIYHLEMLRVWLSRVQVQRAARLLQQMGVIRYSSLTRRVYSKLWTSGRTKQKKNPARPRDERNSPRISSRIESLLEYPALAWEHPRNVSVHRATHAPPPVHPA